MLTLFRWASLAEGLSLLAILAVTIGWIPRDFVFPIGMTHGVLFLAYIVLSLVVTHQQRWSVLVWLGLLFASIVPFGFVAVDLALRKASRSAAAPEAH